MSARALLAACLAMVAAAGCDDTFRPTEPGEVEFSVFGFLDASADTQWVRVMPLRELAVTSPEPLGARVRLEHVGSGRVIELRDSVFRFGTPDVGSEGRFLHNFWTPERLQPGATYRFSVARGEEAPVQTAVAIPKDYETEVWITQRPPLGSDTLWLGGLRYVALVARTTYFYDNCGEGVERIVAPHVSADADVQRVGVSSVLSQRATCGTATVEKRELTVAGSGAPWPAGRTLQTAKLGGFADASGIPNSVGFLGGVLTRVVPYETCQLLGPGPVTDPCKLRYDASSATLVGRARDANCGFRSVPRVEVRLQEIDPAPGARPRLRPVLTTRAGGFEIGALEAGKRYSLTLHRLHPAFRYHQFQEYADTLEFAAGQRLAYDADLKGIEPCSDPA